MDSTSEETFCTSAVKKLAYVLKNLVLALPLLPLLLNAFKAALMP